MKTLHKISVKSNYLHLWPGLLVVAFVVLYSIYEGTFSSNSNGKEEPYLLIYIALVSLIPLFILHINYLSCTIGTKVVSVPSSNELIIIKKGSEYRFNINDIILIERFVTYPYEEDRVRWLPWSEYNYSNIVLEHGQSFLITSLIVPDILHIVNVKVITYKVMYPFAKEYSFKVKEVEKEKFQKFMFEKFNKKQKKN